LIFANSGGKCRYSGTASVERTGGTFHVTWEAKGGDREGVWTSAGSKAVGGEVWTRR